ncbi:hypothetical protein AB0B51_31500, partial [Streptomyces griseus]
MDPAVADQHIGLYVNEFTADLGEDGYAAGAGYGTSPRGRSTRIPPVRGCVLALRCTASDAVR